MQIFEHNAISVELNEKKEDIGTQQNMNTAIYEHDDMFIQCEHNKIRFVV